MALEFNTIGIKLGYAIGSGASRPTSGYQNIPDIKNIPSMDLTPSKLEVTNLIDPIKRYIPGVKDGGNDVALTANMTSSLKSLWASLVASANSAWASGNSTWFEISIPNFDSFYFAGLPTDLGFNAAGVDAVMEASLHIIPNQIAGWATAST